MHYQLYVRVPLHVKQILLQFICAEPLRLTGRGYGVKDKLMLPSKQPELTPTNKYHYMVVLASGVPEETSLAHLSDVLSDQANMLLKAWVLAKTHAGCSAMEAVASFLGYCNIDDDTYSIESCWRQWMRLKTKA